jgi:hypothetical protein
MKFSICQDVNNVIRKRMFISDLIKHLHGLIKSDKTIDRVEIIKTRHGWANILEVDFLRSLESYTVSINYSKQLRNPCTRAKKQKRSKDFLSLTTPPDPPGVVSIINKLSRSQEENKQVRVAIRI